MSAVVIRHATLHDLDAIMSLEASTFPADAWNRDMMLSEIASPHTLYLIALEGENLVGYAGLSAPSESAQADIQTIAVAATHRRRGIATTLMQCVLTAAGERGASEVLLEVRADNPGAQELYRRHGFVSVAVRPRYYQPDDVDAVVMCRSLAEGIAS